MRTPPRVFISYSHDSEDHRNHVQDLSKRLLADGIDCRLDEYEPSPPEGWPRWMSTQIDQAEFVLVICTETYNRRADGKESPGIGHGANWEGLLITQQIFEDAGRNNKFIPVLLRESDALHVPKFLKPYSRYCVETPKGLKENEGQVLQFNISRRGRGSGSSGCFGLSRACGSTNERDQPAPRIR